MNKKVIAVIVAVVVTGLGVFLIMTNKSSAPPAPENAQTTDQSQTQDTKPTATAVITYSADGFSPATSTVNSGDTVTITNTSSSTLQFDSDPHPAHTDNPELNVGTVPAGQSTAFVVTKKGAFGFHNHLNSSESATVIVQ